MSLGAALSNALSGLSFATKSTELISSNISNALSPNYGKRSLAVSTRLGDHGGVAIDAIRRDENKALVASLRMSTAQLNSDRTRADFSAALGRLIGETTSEYSLGSDFNAFRNAMIEAAGMPHDAQRISRAVSVADRVATKISTAAKGIEDLRVQMKKSIGQSLNSTNKTLQSLQKLNASIAGSSKKTGQMAGLLDQRNQLLNELAANVEFKIYHRENGQIALYTPEGARLLEGSASVISTAQDTATGEISFLINGDRETRFGAGNLAGLAQIYNVESIGARSQLDDLADDLVSTFADQGIDPSLLAGEQGLFISSDGARDLAINTKISAEPWRLRDGLNAIGETNLPNEDILLQMTRVLSPNDLLSSNTRDIVTSIDETRARSEQNVARSQSSLHELSL